MRATDIAEITARLQAACMAAPGPWQYVPGEWNDDVVWDTTGMGVAGPVVARPRNSLAESDWCYLAAFIAQAPNDIRRLLDYIRELQDAVARHEARR